jgi:hypothetical protein
MYYTQLLSNLDDPLEIILSFKKFHFIPLNPMSILYQKINSYIKRYQADVT